jgi:peptidoglycan/xylan/chitin deacetylase (PgdA/CDA1 family)
VYKLTRPHFREHLKAVHEKNVGVSLVAQDPGPTTPVLWTFDDGGASFYDPIAPMLEEYGWRGHFFLSTDFIDTKGFLTRPQVRELRSRGHVIGSHSCSHPLRMAACSRNQLDYEWSKSIQVLSEITGEEVNTASVPGGWYSKQVGESAALAGIQFLFTSEPVTAVSQINKMLVLGRFAIQRNTLASEAAALARGNAWPAFRQRAWWSFKKAFKTVGGSAYTRVRARLLTR